MATHNRHGGPRAKQAGQIRSEISKRMEALPIHAAASVAILQPVVKAIKSLLAPTGLFEHANSQELFPEDFASHPSCLKIWQPHYREPADFMLKSLCSEGQFQNVNLSNTPDSVRECKRVAVSKISNHFAIDLLDLSVDKAASRLHAAI